MIIYKCLNPQFEVRVTTTPIGYLIEVYCPSTETYTGPQYYAGDQTQLNMLIDELREKYK